MHFSASLLNLMQSKNTCIISSIYQFIIMMLDGLTIASVAVTVLILDLSILQNIRNVIAKIAKMTNNRTYLLQRIGDGSSFVRDTPAYHHGTFACEWQSRCGQADRSHSDVISRVWRCSSFFSSRCSTIFIPTDSFYCSAQVQLLKKKVKLDIWKPLLHKIYSTSISWYLLLLSPYLFHPVMQNCLKSWNRRQNFQKW